MTIIEAFNGILKIITEDYLPAIPLLAALWVAYLKLYIPRLKSDLKKRNDEDLAILKSELAECRDKLNGITEGKVHITKAQYEMELEIYKKLWESIVDIERIICRMDRHGKESDEKVESLDEKCHELGLEILKNAPFYSKDIAEKLKNVQGKMQIVGTVNQKWFEKYWKKEVLFGEWLDESDTKRTKAIIDIENLIRTRMEEISAI